MSRGGMAPVLERQGYGMTRARRPKPSQPAAPCGRIRDQPSIQRWVRAYIRKPPVALVDFCLLLLL